MERDPGKFKRRDELDAGAADDAALEDAPNIVDAGTAAAIAEARRDIAEGRVVPHEQVAVWLKTWGTSDYKPMPREWLR